MVLWLLLAGSAAAQVELPQIQLSDPITVAADSGNRFMQGSYEVLILHGRCYINQGLTYARSDDAVLWMERTGSRNNPQFKVIAYLENNVTIDYQQGPAAGPGDGKLQGRVTDKSWFGRFTSNVPLTIHIDNVADEPAVKPPVYQHGMQARDPATPDTSGDIVVAGANPDIRALPAVGPGLDGLGVEPAQLLTPGGQPGQGGPMGPGQIGPGGVVGGPAESIGPGGQVAPGGPPAGTLPPPGPAGRPQAGPRRLRAFPRSDARVQAQVFPNAAANETVVVVSSGVNLIVDGMEGYGSIDVAADRIVLWKQGAAPDLTGQSGESNDTPLELYMEGNIVFRQADRVIFADRMYYDVRTKRGIILHAEMLTPAPSYSGLVRLRADVLRQVDENQFTAQRAGLTSSRMGAPTFEFRAGQATFTDVQQPKVNFFTGQQEVDPITGDPIIEHQRQLKSTNNFLYVGPVPVFYWPYMSTDLEEPNYYLQSVRFGEDTIFGYQARLTFNAYQLLGMKRPPGTQWTVSADYFSLRGPAVGTQFRFDRPDFLGLIQGRNYGIFDAWGIVDHGFDVLGRDRRDDPPSTPDRGRLILRDRMALPNNYQFTLEVGAISDFNFLEQYFETEWDQLKNESTGAELKRYDDNTSYSANVDVRVNYFFTETNWLPRGDHYTMGQSLLGDRLTWFEHTSLGYAQYKVLNKPTDAEDLAAFQYLPWEIYPGQQGDREATRQEIDLPFSLGVAKFTPYALGELAHWGQVLSGNPAERAYGTVGFRASVPFWSVNPLIDSDLLNVHGLAHKVVLSLDLGYTASTQPVTIFPLYDAIDDNNILAFRRRIAVDDFNGALPPQFDARFWALRYGMMNDVSSPVTEIAGNMAAVRLAAQQRWQTKRGPAANRKVMDWITLDTSAVIFPDASRDDFGQAVGMVNYDFNWYVGDRVTVQSNGYYDFYSMGPKFTTFGAFLNRPPRSAFYAGVRSLEGPIHATVLIGSYSYRMSPKWYSSFSTSYALGGQGNIGEAINLTRIGEAFLMSVGTNVDASKGNLGFMFGIEPRFLGNKARFGATTGALIPPAGAFGLE